MPARLSIQEIRPEGKQELGRLEGDEIVLGREPSPNTNGITIRSDAVSREHGLITPLRSHWLYKDLGSTNGSWLNGSPVKEGQWKLVRAGDVVQLADSAVQLSALPGSAEVLGTEALPSATLRSLLVFSRGAFMDEFPIPEHGRAIAIGGSKADLRLDVDLNELPSLVIERRGDRVVAFGIAKECPIYVNEKEISNTVMLSDRDEIKVSHFVILLNDPPATPDLSSQAGAVKIHQPTSRREVTRSGDMPLFNPAARAMDPMNRTSTRLVFGTDNERDDGVPPTGTIALDVGSIQSRLAAREGHPSMRHAAEDEIDSETAADMLTERVIVFIGSVLLMTLVMLLIWWMLF